MKAGLTLNTKVKASRYQLIVAIGNCFKEHSIQVMLGDLITDLFETWRFRMLRLDAQMGEGAAAVIRADASDKLGSRIAKVVGGGQAQ